MIKITNNDIPIQEKFNIKNHKKLHLNPSQLQKAQVYKEDSINSYDSTLVSNVNRNNDKNNNRGSINNIKFQQTIKQKHQNLLKQQKEDLLDEKYKNKSEEYDIFGHEKTFIFSYKKGLNKRIANYKKSYQVIEFLQQESIKHINEKTFDRKKEQNTADLDLINRLEENLEIIKNIIPLLESAVKVKYDRNLLDQVNQQILQLTFKSKNQCLNALTLKMYAKMQQIWGNYDKAIYLFKMLKNQSNHKLLLRFKMKAYKHLGTCFSFIKRYDLSLLYFGKCLKFAWYLNDIDQEIKCYDYIGVQFFYQGKLKQAQYFHYKMINGIHEDQHSDLRRLGISKVNNSLNVQKNEKSSTMQNVIKKLKNKDPFDRYIISSSEDEFDLPVHHDIQEQDQNDLIESIKPKKYNPYHIIPQNQFSKTKERKKFSVTENLSQKDHFTNSLNKANKNIRLFAQQQKMNENREMEPRIDYTPSSFMNVGDGLKTAFNLSHLSVNRELENYQKIDGRMLQQNKDTFNDRIYDQFEKGQKQKIIKILQRYINNLMFTISHMQYIIQLKKNKQHNSTNNIRRSAFLVTNHFKDIDNTTYKEAYMHSSKHNTYQDLANNIELESNEILKSSKNFQNSINNIQQDKQNQNMLINQEQNNEQDANSSSIDSQDKEFEDYQQQELEKLKNKQQRLLSENESQALLESLKDIPLLSQKNII